MYRIADAPAHNHPPESEQQKHVAFINECVAEAGKLLNESPRDIYDRVLKNYPGLAVVYNGAMQQRIQRAKRKAIALLQFQHTCNQVHQQTTGKIFT